MTRRSVTLRWCLLFLLGAASRSAQAQRIVEVDRPKAFRMQFTEQYLQTDLEFDRETQQVSDPPTSVIRQRLMVQPVVGLGVGGSVYHPNLLQYKLNTELGADWQETRQDPGGSASSLDFLQRYHGSIDLLQLKPYTVNLFADKDITYRDYDFFSRVRVESQRCGGRTGYSAGPVPFSVTAQHYDEVIVDDRRPAELTEDTITLNAQSMRRSDAARTQLSYNLDRFYRVDDGFSQQRGLNQNLSLIDNEGFGDDSWITLNSLGNYNSVAETTQPTERLLLQENLRLQHSSKLRSFYEYAFDTASAGPSDSISHQGRAGLGYEPTETYSATWDLHGIRSSATGLDSFSDTCRYGTSLDQQYNRPLNAWSSVMLGYNGRIDREERTSSGQMIGIMDESHVLTDGTTTFLNQPGATASSVHVTDKNQTITYIEGLDYRIIQHGSLLQIERITGGKITPGQEVFVDYDAQLQPSARYYSYDNNLLFRYDLWKGLLGFYGRWSILDYIGGDDLMLRWLNSKTVGVDSTWKWLRTGAEYELADSNLAPYERARLFQSIQFQPNQNSNVGLEFDQNWTHFQDTGMSQNSYGFILRYQERLTEHLSWNSEGGVRIDRGYTNDRDTGVGRLGLDYAIGKLAVKFGYEYGRESQPATLSQRHHFYLRIRRSF
ncbi:MAG: hypothetical protein NTX27_16805 [Verrucomicrobia bacterium]|nr:hypothetical protein [Verrucomicrobiota bacterium]